MPKILLICLITYTYPSGKTDHLPVEGYHISTRFDISQQRTVWLIDATAFMSRTGMQDNLNPGMVWAEENLCLGMSNVK